MRIFDFNTEHTVAQDFLQRVMKTFSCRWTTLEDSLPYLAYTTTMPKTKIGKRRSKLRYEALAENGGTVFPCDHI